MLSSLTKIAREHRAHAANAHALANATANASAKKLYLDFERYWLDCAKDFEAASVLCAEGRRGARMRHTPFMIATD
jgi:hypothetical protein